MQHGNDRAPRVAALIRRELSGLLRDKVKDPRVASAVVSDVVVSRDLSFARVYLLPAGDAAGGAGVDPSTLEGFERAAGFLRGALAERLNLRIVPQLKFLNDETQLHSDRIEQLLAEEKQRK